MYLKQKNVKAFIVGLTVLFQLSCDTTNHVETARKQSEKYYRWLASGKIDSLVTLFSREFYSVSDTNLVIKILDERLAHGKIVSAACTNTSQKVNYMNGEKNIEVSLLYKVTYSSGEVFAETFNFVSGEPFSDRVFGLDFSQWKEE